MVITVQGSALTFLVKSRNSQYNFTNNSKNKDNTKGGQERLPHTLRGTAEAGSPHKPARNQLRLCFGFRFFRG